jgi:hypothetical protein
MLYGHYAGNNKSFPDFVQKEKEMDIETYLDDAQRNQYQPYYACYWFCFDRPMGEFKDSNADYINWIDERHREFSPQAKHHIGSGMYFNEFMAYLKKYVTENRITTAST